MVRTLFRRRSGLIMSMTLAGCFVTFSAGYLLASEDVKHAPKLTNPIVPVAECGSCTRRHQALAKAKKLREKKRLAPATPEKTTPTQ